MNRWTQSEQCGFLEILALINIRYNHAMATGDPSLANAYASAHAELIRGGISNGHPAPDKLRELTKEVPIIPIEPPSGQDVQT